MTDVETPEPAAQQVSGKGERSSNTPRKASTTVSTRASRRTASPSRSSKQDDGPPTPESPPFRLTRKRAASLADKADRDDDSEEAAPLSHSRMSSGGASAGSAGSAASHVCLCQPDPKIPRPRNAFILYRQHHQAAIVAQHPGLANPDISKIIGEQWRAQPESVRNEWKALAEEEKIRHQQQYPEYRYQPRRGGRRGSLSSINTTPDKHHCNKCGGRSITTPTTPFAASASSTPMLPPPTPSSAVTPTSRYLPPMMSNLAINTAQARRTRPTPGPLNGIHVARGRDDMDLQMLSPLSPDAKRRRYNQAYVPPSARPVPGTPYPFPPDPRRQSLPRPDILRGPSPRGAQQSPGQHDSSLTLPPLQTATSPSSGVQEPQRRSVEAMVMSMPFWGKIRVLGKISPPYRLSTPATIVRGAIVAVEGDDRTAVQQMSKWLEENLNKTGETHARVAEAPRGPPTAAAADGGGNNGKSPGSAVGRPHVGLGDYIAVIAEWHGKTADMVDFITNPPREADDGSPTPTVDRDAAVAESSGGTKKTPVLIMPTYNLSAADNWASRIPITDNYSPADHWQWVATLWRGIVGPDITVYIKDVGSNELELTGGRAVEVREDGQTKCLVVKRVNAKEIDESALRRLGFEVGELIRSVSGMNAK